MNQADDEYLRVCKHILEKGTTKKDRTGTGTKSIFGEQMRFDLQEGFPLLTTKDLGGNRLNSIIRELLWFLSGDTNIKPLVDNGVNIWNRDAYKHYTTYTPNPMSYADFVQEIRENDNFADVFGDLGPIYGKQWRNWQSDRHNTVDQIKNVIELIKHHPDSRRHIVTAWNPGDLSDMALPPCHVLFQFYVANGELSCQLFQRSNDFLLGIPYNIASYSLLTMMIAQVTGLKPKEFIHSSGDAHIYLNHIEQVREQLQREPRHLPTMRLNERVRDIFDFTVDDFTLTDYHPHPAIKAKQSF